MAYVLGTGKRLRLQEQPARVLDYLVHHAGRAVSRDELIAHIWADGRHVQFDQGLNYCIRQIRAALGDSASAPRFVASVGRSGYRWIGPVPRRASRLQTFIARPVPAWVAAAASTTCVVGTMWMAPVPPASREARADHGADLRAAVHSLHVLSHSVIDPVLPDSVVRLFNRD